MRSRAVGERPAVVDVSTRRQRRSGRTGVSALQCGSGSTASARPKVAQAPLRAPAAARTARRARRPSPRRRTAAAGRARTRSGRRRSASRSIAAGAGQRRARARARLRSRLATSPPREQRASAARTRPPAARWFASVQSRRAIRRVHAIIDRAGSRNVGAPAARRRSMIGLSMPSMRSRARCVADRRVRDHEVERRSTGGRERLRRDTRAGPSTQRRRSARRAAPGAKSSVKLAVPRAVARDADRQAGDAAARAPSPARFVSRGSVSPGRTHARARRGRRRPGSPPACARRDRELHQRRRRRGRRPRRASRSIVEAVVGEHDLAARAVEVMAAAGRSTSPSRATGWRAGGTIASSVGQRRHQARASTTTPRSRPVAGIDRPARQHRQRRHAPAACASISTTDAV